MLYGSIVGPSQGSIVDLWKYTCLMTIMVVKAGMSSINLETFRNSSNFLRFCCCA